MTNNIPQKGFWYELIDFSDRDYGSDWGFILYKNGQEIRRNSGFSKIRWAGDAAREAKDKAIREARKQC